MLQQLLYREPVEVLPMGDNDIPVQCRVGHLGRLSKQKLLAMGAVLPETGVMPVLSSDQCPACLDGDRELHLRDMPHTD